MLINHLVKDHVKSEIHKNDSPSSRFMKFEARVKTIHCNGVLLGSFPKPPFTPKSGKGFLLRGCAQGGELDHSHGEGSVVTSSCCLSSWLDRGLFLTLGLGN